jgi:tryptophan 2,3-dioxygenase
MIADGQRDGEPMTQLDYATYLKLPQLLSAQERESEKRGNPAHDEMLFIIMHQTYELWFKEILFEIDWIQHVFGGECVDDAELASAVHGAERVVKIEQLLISQIDVLETMTPMDFLEFRDCLAPASGFQSEQFRIIETRLGLKREQRLAVAGANFDEQLPHDARTRIQAIERCPTLREQVDAWLSRTPFVDMGGFQFREAYARAVDSTLTHEIELIQNNDRMPVDEREKQIAALQKARAMLDSLIDDGRYAEQKAKGAWTMSRRALEAALFIFLYRDEPALHLPFKMLKLLMDIDENLALWRLRHALMVSRMIGRKVGTGGSSGYGYLRATAEKHRVYDDLFAMGTFLIRRSAMPALPKAVRSSMRYRYEN